MDNTNLKDEYVSTANTCVMCGEVIPEGRQVCLQCEKGVKDNDR